MIEANESSSRPAVVKLVMLQPTQATPGEPTSRYERVERYEMEDLRRLAESTDPADLVGVLDASAFESVTAASTALETVLETAAAGARYVGWSTGRSDVSSLVAPLVTSHLVPPLLAPAGTWSEVFETGPATWLELTDRMYRAVPQLVALHPPVTSPQAAAVRLDERPGDESAYARAIELALTLDRHGVPDWAGRAPAVVDALLTGAVRDASLDRTLLADLLVELSSLLASHPRSLRERTAEIVDAAVRGATRELRDLLRLRVLVAGHDLKFINFVYPQLPDSVVVREDVWTGEKRHDAAASRDLLAWADVIWVEWLVNCALWYSARKRDDQVLIVRQHRYELLRDTADGIDYDAVDAVVAIAVHTLEAVHERFGVPRSKLRIIPNIYEPDRYVVADPDDRERQFQLALVGSVPRLKGFHRAIEVLEHLRRTDERYTLTVFGRLPHELPWIGQRPDEAAYFEACSNYIVQRGLESAVIFAGWADIRRELHRYGYVLSTSDLEGSHVSPGEAYLVGNLGVYLRWRGSEYVYPSEFGFGSPADMAAYIAGEPLFDETVRDRIAQTSSYLATEQGTEAFLENVGAIIRQARL